MATDKQPRKTRVLRVGTPEFWVDLEVLEKTEFGGKQWQGPDKGNQSQDTILSLLAELSGGGDTVVIKNLMGKEVDISNDLKSNAKATSKTRDTVKINAKATSKVVTRGNTVKRTFNNKQEGKGGNNARKDQKRRIQFNYISEEFLNEGVPPVDPKDYIKAVKQTKDTSRIWLDIAMAAQYFMKRGGNFIEQGVVFKDTFHGKVNLPGSSDKVDPAGPWVRLDPYQVVVNFGPDGLAVEFN